MDRRIFNTIAFFSIFCLFCVNQLSCVSSDHTGSGKKELYHSSEFTPASSFTHGVEGPAVDKSGNVYAVNFGHEGTIGIIPLNSVPSLFVQLPVGSIGNGIRFNSHGDMLIADYKMHNILKVEMNTKTISVYAHNSEMTQPNDLAIDSKDVIFASDPDFKANTGGIWKVDTHGHVTLVDSMSSIANGIEVSPDEKKLYVGYHRKIFSYDLHYSRSVGNKKLLIEFRDFSTDGMRWDTKGNLYIARIGKGVVAEVSPSGELLKEIKLVGKNPTNIAFGGKDGRTVYVTLMDRGNLESFQVDNPGREWKMRRAKIQ